MQETQMAHIRAMQEATDKGELQINVTSTAGGRPIACLLYTSFPELTEERRKELAKDVKKKGEAAKVAVRNIRRDGNVAFKKLKGTEISEDGIKDLEDELQKITDKYIEKIDKMCIRDRCYSPPPAQSLRGPRWS